MTKAKKQADKDKAIVDLEQQVGELTLDLQRTRADFENYRKRVDEEKVRAKENGATSMVMKLLPVVDDIERAIEHVPKELAKDKWVQGIVGLTKKLEKTMDDLNIKRIDAKPGVEFNPEIHNAIQIDEEAEGDKEVIAEELQAGYLLNDMPVRPAIVKVTRK